MAYKTKAKSKSRKKPVKVAAGRTKNIKKVKKGRA